MNTRILRGWKSKLNRDISASFVIVCIGIGIVTKLLALYSVWIDESGAIAPDSEQYLILSENLKWYFNSSIAGDQTLSLLRPLGYPLFLNLLSQSIFSVVLVQLFLYVFLVIDVFKVVRVRLGANTARLVLVFLMIEPSLTNSIFLVYADFVFAVSIWMMCRIVLISFPAGHDKIVAALGSLLCIFIKPVGIFVLGILILIWLLNPRIRRRVVIPLVIMSLAALIQFSWNYQKTGIFMMSSIESHNLLFYEAAGVLALENEVPLEVVQKDLRIQLEKLTGESYEYGREGWLLANVDKERKELGFRILFANPERVLELHARGAFSLLFGVGKGDLARIYAGLSNFSMYESLLLIFGFLLVCLVTCLTILFITGLALHAKLSNDHSLLYYVPIIIILVSSGAQAYSRFRAPISVLMIIGAAISFEALVRRLRLEQEKN